MRSMERGVTTQAAAALLFSLLPSVTPSRRRDLATTKTKSRAAGQAVPDTEVGDQTKTLRGRNHMRLMKREVRMPAAVAAGALLALALPLSAVQAQQQPIVMKISTPTIHDIPDTWARNFAGAVEKDSGGRIKAEVYPASQLGSIPREIEGVQFGSIQVFVGPPEFLVGVDQRYEVLSAPGVVNDLAHEVRMVADPELQKLMFSFGADKGIHGNALFVAQPSNVISRVPIRRLADFKGKKLRVLAADMQEEMIKSLDASPVAMTLGDVLPALQQGAIDGSVLAFTVESTMHFWDAAKYVTEINQPFIFSMAFFSKKWFDALPKDLQTLVDADAAKAAAEVNLWEVAFFARQREVFAQHGELISLPPAEQAAMMKQFRAVGAEVAKRKPALEQAYNVFAAVAKRTQQ
jgi:TRAP-type C4-dicarboxylate transport system substrate-binding protein